MPVRVISDEANLKAELAGANKNLVLVFFEKSWCPVCQKINPGFEELSNKYSNVIFLRIDAETCPKIAAAHNITNVPTFIFYRNNVVVDRVEENAYTKSPKGLENKIQEHSK